MKKRLSPWSKTSLYLAQAIGRLIPSCREVTQLVSESMEESLPLTKRMGVKLHLLMCVWCRRYRQQLLLMRQMIRRYLARLEAGRAEPTISLPAQARQRIERALRQNNL